MFGKDANQLTNPEIWSYSEKKQPQLCPVCKGRGTVHIGFYDGLGLDMETMTSNNTKRPACKSCNGQGYILC